MKTLIYSCLFSFACLFVSTLAWADDPAPDNCLQCHFVGRTDSLNHTPAADNMCDVCHEKNDKHYKIDYSSAVCLNCHDKNDDLAFRHKALDLPKQCVSCHNPHGSEERSFLKMPVNNLCASCHKPVGDTTGAKTTHKVAYTEAGCITCHLPHSSKNGKLLKIAQEDLCLTCHNKEMPYTGGYPRKEKNVKNIQKLIETSTYAHPPAQEKQCAFCHTPHQSKEWWLIKNNTSPASRNAQSKNWSFVNDRFKMCFECHNIDMLNEKITNKETRYRSDKIVKLPWWQGGGIKIVRKNLHRSHGGHCTACHDVHGGEKEHLIHKQWRAIPQGGTCGAGCHGDLDRYEFGVIYKRID